SARDQFIPVMPGFLQVMNAIFHCARADPAPVRVYSVVYENHEGGARLSARTDADLMPGAAGLDAQERYVARAARGARNPPRELRAADRHVQETEQRVADDLSRRQVEQLLGGLARGADREV